MTNEIIGKLLGAGLCLSYAMFCSKKKTLSDKDLWQIFGIFSLIEVIILFVFGWRI